MKILFVHDHKFFEIDGSFYSNGGLSNAVLKRYSSVFNEIHVLSRQVKIKSDSLLQKKLSPSSDDNTHFIKVPDYMSLKKFKNFKSAIKILDHQIKNCDGLIVRIPSQNGYNAIKIADKYKKKYIVELVGCPYDSLKNYGGIVSKVLAPLEYMKCKKIMRKSQKSIYVTEDFLQKRYPTKGKSINCSNVNITIEETNVLGKRINKINNFSTENTIKIGMIGGLENKYKGFDLAIKALNILKKNHSIKISLHILGGGNRDEIKKIAKKYDCESNIYFDGTLPSDKVNEWIDEIDILLHPSKTEGLPRAVIEAMSRGCPIICSDVGGLPELIDPQYIFKSGDYKKMSDLIKESCISKQLQIKMSKENFERAQEYDQKILNSRRAKFLNDFKNEL